MKCVYCLCAPQMHVQSDATVECMMHGICYCCNNIDDDSWLEALEVPRGGYKSAVKSPLRGA